MMGEEYPSCDGRYHTQPHYQPRTYSRSSRSCCAYSEQRCKARRRRWRPVERGRRRIRAWTSCRNQWKGAQATESQNQIQFLHRKSGRSGSLVEKSSCPGQISYVYNPLVYLLPRHDGSYPKYHPRSLCQLYSDHERSYWQRLPYR
jgi:hypothetical protein